MQPLPLLEEVERGAKKHDEESERLDVRRERDDPRRGGRADVGADDDVDRLRQRHEAGGNESDDHDGDDRRRLDDHRRDDARADSGQAVRGRERHEPAKARSADGLESLGQMLHPQQERAESTADHHKNRQCFLHICIQYTE